MLGFAQDDSLVRIHASAPTRIDLAGGTLDLWPLYLFHPGAVTVNVAITRYAHAVAEARGDGRIVLISRDSERREEFASARAMERAARYKLPLLAELVKWFLSGDPSACRPQDDKQRHEKQVPRLHSALSAKGRSFASFDFAQDKRDDNRKKGVTLTTWSEAPAGAGLGGSSAMGVAVCGALARLRAGFRLRPTLRLRSGQAGFGGQVGGQGARRRAAAPHEWIAVVRDVEARILGVPTGEQDHYPAVYGGASAIHLEPGRTWREELPVRAEELESRLVLVYTGKPRKSGINNWEVLKNYIDGDRGLRRNFEEIAEAAREMRAALLRGDWRAVAEAMRRDAEARRKNSPGIETPFIRTLAKTGKKNGALAAKVCGAGGGGCVVFLCEPKKRGELASALASAGATLLPFRVAGGGVQTRTEK